MTTAVLPEFILNVLESEISSITLNVVKCVCDEYNLPFEEVKTKIAKYICIELKTTETANYKVIKSHTRRVQLEEDERCIANMMCPKTKETRQCTRRRLENEDCKFCRTHMKMFDADELKYGTIED
jgi:hypothetical protein